MIAVRDPVEEGNVPPDGMSALVLGIVRAHLASLLRPLGHERIADALDALRTATVTSTEPRRAEAITAVDEAPREVLTRGDDELTDGDGLIGGVITRSGPVRADLSIADQAVLERLDLGATFVGVDVGVVVAAIKGDRDDLEKAIVLYRLKVPEVSRYGNSGTWIQPLRDGYGVQRRKAPTGS
jgi:hypothetical protein